MSATRLPNPRLVTAYLWESAPPPEEKETLHQKLKDMDLFSTGSGMLIADAFTNIGGAVGQSLLSYVGRLEECCQQNKYQVVAWYWDIEDVTSELGLKSCSKTSHNRTAPSQRS